LPLKIPQGDVVPLTPTTFEKVDKTFVIIIAEWDWNFWERRKKMAKFKKGGLGKGLGAIFIENENESDTTPITLRISEIEPNKSQPRRDFDENSLSELAQSISQHGVLQPILVRPIADGGYQIVAGERRWRASRMAGLSEVPVVIRELTDLETAEIALIENLQREDLTPIEEALGLKKLMEEYEMSQDDISKIVGKSRPSIANTLRLLTLPQEVIDLIHSGKLSAGHGRTLLGLKNPEEIIKYAKVCIENDVSVRHLENIIKKINSESDSNVSRETIKKKTKRLSYYDEVQLSLNEHLGRKVTVNGNSKDKGTLEIEFYSKEDLFALAQLLGRNKM